MRTEAKCGSNVYAKKRNFCSNGLSKLRNTMGWAGAGLGGVRCVGECVAQVLRQISLPLPTPPGSKQRRRGEAKLP